MLIALILSISLSIDALFVGLSYGIRKVKIPIISKVIIAVFSVVYAIISMQLGVFLQKVLPQNIANIIGISLLVAVGLYIIVQGIIKKETEEVKAKKQSFDDEKPFKFVIKSYGITIQVIKDPNASDIDNSGKIEPVEALILGLALSIDVLSAGVAIGMSGATSWWIAFLIGLFQMTFLSAGGVAGGRLSEISWLNKRAMSVVSGLIIILVAILRIF